MRGGALPFWEWSIFDHCEFGVSSDVLHGCDTVWHFFLLFKIDLDIISWKM